MRLLNAVDMRVITLPTSLEKQFLFFSTCEISDGILREFVKALNVVLMCALDEGIDLEKRQPLHIIFSEDGAVSFDKLEPEVYGCVVSLAVYHMAKVREADQHMRLVIFAEELVHHIWRIFDETAVKYKVVECLNPIDDAITIDFLKRFGVYGLSQN